jgi:hypothetical protein
MALTCNAFAARTANNFRDAMQGASCVKTGVPVQPLPPDNFRAALLDGLFAIAQAQGLTIPIAGISPCDIETAMYNLNCAIEGTGDKFPDIDPDTFQGIVVYFLNQILCAGI